MSWWENFDDEFKEFLANLIGVGVSTTLAQDQLFKEPIKDPKSYSTIGPNIPKTIGRITQEHEKAAGVSTPSPSATPSPSSTSSDPPALKTGASNDDSDFAKLEKMARENMPAQRQTQGNISGMDPDALVYDPTKKKTQIGPQSEFAPKVTNLPYRKLSDVARDPFDWDPKKVKEMTQMMIHAGLIRPNEYVDRVTLSDAWARLAANSAGMLEKGHKMTPLRLLTGLANGDIGGGVSTGPKTVTSTDTNYTVTNATTAKQLAQAALSQRVGRKATDDEVAEFIAALRKEEKANPTVQTTTTTTNAGGTSSSSTSTTKQGVNVEAFQRQYADDYDTEEAKAYQAAGFYAPIFFEALRAPA